VVTTILDKGVKPLSVRNGFLRFFTQTGQIQGQHLASHAFLSTYRAENGKIEDHYKYFLKNYALNNFTNCLVAATKINNPGIFDLLGRRSLEFINLNIA